MRNKRTPKTRESYGRGSVSKARRNREQKFEKLGADARRLRNRILFPMLFLIIFISGCFNGDDDNKGTSYHILLGMTDNEGNRVDGEYSIGYFANNDYMEVSKGELSKDAFVDVMFPYNQTIIYYTWNDNYYNERKYAVGENYEINDSRMLVNKNDMKIGEIKFNHDGELHAGKGNININITVKDGFFRRPLLCINWDSGFLYARIKGTAFDCDTRWDACSRWENDECIEFYPGGYFGCGEDYKNCKELTNGNRTCVTPTLDPPSRVKARRCYPLPTIDYITPSFSTIVEYDAYKIDGDRIEIWIIDRERDITQVHPKMLAEIDGKNVGGSDFYFQIT